MEKKYSLLNYKDSPLISRAEYIPYGYREKNSPFIKDLFYFHNETINIWTHLVGSVYFGYLASLSSRISFSYCVVTSLTLLISSIYHICCSKPSLYKLTFALDLIGMFSIIIFTVNSTMYMITNNLEQNLFTLYYLHSIIFLILTIKTLKYVIGIVTTDNNRQLKDSPMHNLKPVITVLLCMNYNLIYCSHLLIIVGPKTLYNNIYNYYFSWLSWFLGFVFWKLKVPERYNPSYFCMKLTSHNIHHLMIIFNSYWHYTILNKSLLI